MNQHIIRYLSFHFQKINIDVNILRRLHDTERLKQHSLRNGREPFLKLCCFLPALNPLS